MHRSTSHQPLLHAASSCADYCKKVHNTLLASTAICARLLASSSSSTTDAGITKFAPYYSNPTMNATLFRTLDYPFLRELSHLNIPKAADANAIYNRLDSDEKRALTKSQKRIVLSEKGGWSTTSVFMYQVHILNWIAKRTIVASF